MNKEVFIIGLLQLFLSVLVGVVVLYLTYYVTVLIFKKKGYTIEDDNIAFAVFLSSALISVGIIVSSAFSPAFQTLQLIEDKAQDKWELAWMFVKYMSFYLATGLAISTLVLLGSVKFYDMLTKGINELEEISENNVAVALITGVIMIVIAIFAKDSAIMLVESVVPYPELPHIR